MWSHYALDQFFAPKLSDLGVPHVPALSIDAEVSRSWISAFVLTCALRVQIDDPYRQLMFSYLRRVDAAVVNYCQAQTDLAAYLSAKNVGITHYSRCLYAFENCIAMSYQAFLLLRQLVPDKPSLFERGDGSVLQRMDRVYNASKHADEFIANGGRYPPNGTLPVWLVTTGIESVDCVLTFAELAEEIEALARIAKQLATWPPPAPTPATSEGIA